MTSANRLSAARLSSLALDRRASRSRLAASTLAARQPDPAWTQRVAPGPNGRQRHLSAVWDLALEARGVSAGFRVSFPYPLGVAGGSNLPEGQELVCMLAYRLVSGHWRVQTGGGADWGRGNGDHG